MIFIINSLIRGREEITVSRICLPDKRVLAHITEYPEALPTKYVLLDLLSNWRTNKPIEFGPAPLMRTVLELVPLITWLEKVWDLSYEG